MGWPYSPRPARALWTLKDAVNAHWPKRDRTSDGYLGDARHAALGNASDHNPWIQVAGVGVVRAADFDVDGIDAPWLAEQLRLAGARGDERLTDGGYVIWNPPGPTPAQITKADFSGWKPYLGADDHSGHIHVSLSRRPDGFDSPSPWGFLAAAPPAVVVAHPGRVPATSWEPGQDATGADADFRASYGDEGPKIQAMQQQLNEHFPAYSKLEEDGVYGPATAAVVDEFSERAAATAPAADRQALIDSDGRDVGPRTARALDRYGIV